MQSGVLLRAVVAPVSEEHINSVYRYAARTGGIDSLDTVALDLGLDAGTVNEAVRHLVESHLLREEDGGRLLVPVDPEVAAALLVSPMEREIYQRRELIAQIQKRIEVFRQDYASTGRPTSELSSVEHVAGSMEVRGYLKIASDACRDEMMVLRSGRPDDDEFDDFLRMCAHLLDRGVTVRIICQHRSRADLTTRMKIKSLADAGALVRTVSHIPRAAVVFDRSVAVLLGSAGGEATASRVRNDDVVQFLLDVFNHLWDAATPLASFESGYAEVADDLQQTIAGLMAKGFTDEVLARKLGMSVRTCRRHIAALMRDLDAVSRFQAGVQAARRSLVDGA
jgi:DNA-binding CsgD family transcriptional regulator